MTAVKTAVDTTLPSQAPGVSAGSAYMCMVGKPSEPASLLCNSPLCRHRYDDGARGGPHPTGPNRHTTVCTNNEPCILLLKTGPVPAHKSERSASPQGPETNDNVPVLHLFLLSRSPARNSQSSENRTGLSVVASKRRLGRGRRLFPTLGML